eukprot:255130-Hanusia_phi.AAC.1
MESLSFANCSLDTALKQLTTSQIEGNLFLSSLSTDSSVVQRQDSLHPDVPNSRIAISPHAEKVHVEQTCTEPVWPHDVTFDQYKSYWTPATNLSITDTKFDALSTIQPLQDLTELTQIRVENQTKITEICRAMEGSLEEAERELRE